MTLKKLGIQIHKNEDIFLVTTSIDDGIYAEGETVEEALINFLDVYSIVKERKGGLGLLENTEDQVFELPVSV